MSFPLVRECIQSIGASQCYIRINPNTSKPKGIAFNAYSFIQLYYLPYIRLKPELPGEQSLELPALLIAYPALGY